MQNQLYWSLIKRFSSSNKYGFTFQDAVNEFPERHPTYLSQVLSHMVRKGMLYKISRHTYHIIPLNADPESYKPDSHQVTKYLMGNEAYYIGYTAALELHEPGQLDSEAGPYCKDANPGAVQYVVTKKQMKPAFRSIEGRNFRFISLEPSRFFGFESIEINPLEQAMVSDLEKTIVDIASRPQLCGGIVTLGNALNKNRNRISQYKLLQYLGRNQVKSAMKRVLFLTELLALKWTDGHELMLEELGTGISLLDPGAPQYGRQWNKFGVKINVDPLVIKAKVLDFK